MDAAVTTAFPPARGEGDHDRGGDLHLYRRQGRHYREVSVTKAAELLELTEPVRTTIRPEELLP
ncbi:hypothetical protein ACFOOK_09670 [Micromonospora krabiensis]|uniref:hypothetical protein n=1 Tax=Micromonospora krabiensis TaxID=307121 RepID=UPI001E393E30|nr:hypothetical protein [Micromonospora krabiensis]